MRVLQCHGVCIETHPRSAQGDLSFRQSGLSVAFESSGYETAALLGSMQSAVVILVTPAPIGQTGKATVTEPRLIHQSTLMRPADLLYMLL